MLQASLAKLKKLLASADLSRTPPASANKNGKSSAVSRPDALPSGGISTLAILRAVQYLKGVRKSIS